MLSALSSYVSEDAVLPGAFSSEGLRTESRHTAQPEQLTVPGLHAVWSLLPALWGLLFASAVPRTAPPELTPVAAGVTGMLGDRGALGGASAHRVGDCHQSPLDTTGAGKQSKQPSIPNRHLRSNHMSSSAGGPWILYVASASDAFRDLNYTVTITLWSNWLFLR